jgi:hypothetical protein
MIRTKPNSTITLLNQCRRTQRYNKWRIKLEFELIMDPFQNEKFSNFLGGMIDEHVTCIS